uniref:Ubiquitin-like domain-containing protein n=1 Tax=Musa acuminata subsp. malaccensis TaxID=214687 RepID=A0A804J1V3_MUSAM
MEGAKDAGGDRSAITVQVKFCGRTLPVSLPMDATVADLKSLLQPVTNVLTRGQTLICKGKVLADKVSLKSVPVTNGSKVMLIASQGLHQGDGPITKDAATQSISPRKLIDTKQTQVSHTRTNVEKSRSERWKLTGVVALSECHLEAMPEEVWSCGHSVRVLDVSNNLIRDVPTKVGDLKLLNKLLLNANNITDESISWEGLSSLKSLTILSLSHNYLTTLPSAVGTLTSLCQLHIANNKITSLPDELGLLNQLQILKVANNRLSSMPSSIGNCRALVEALILRNNGLKSLPPTLFKMCYQLSTLDLHGTEITNDFLRQIEGWEDFDERRRSKHQKQLDFRVGSSGVFDEGADDDRALK